MKPAIHAENSAKQFGGKPEDYMKIHQWFDQTKAHMGDNRHRAILHNSWGIFLAESVFGITIINSDGKLVSVRDIGEQHVFEDLGFIPSISDYLSKMSIEDWMCGKSKPQKKENVYDGTKPAFPINDIPLIPGGDPKPVKHPPSKCTPDAPWWEQTQIRD
jgi:hypothetical protein